MDKKTARLTISVPEGTPEHTWLYGMNKMQRGFAAQQALRVYCHLVTSGQISVLTPIETIGLSPAPSGLEIVTPESPIIAPPTQIEKREAVVVPAIPAVPVVSADEQQQLALVVEEQVAEPGAAEEQELAEPILPSVFEAEQQAGLGSATRVPIPKDMVDDFY